MRVYNRDENGVWDGEHPSFFAIGETDEGEARERRSKGL